jgi:hypothetical protein
MEPSTFAAFIPIWLLLLVILPAQRRKKRTILANKILNKELENTKMFELAKRFIEKECVIYTFDGNQYIGTLKEVTEGAILMEKRGATEAINLNFVVKIKEIVKCKK